MSIDERLRQEQAEIGSRTPEVRVRIKHSATTKGWRVDETTVEITRPLDAGPKEAAYYSALMRSELYAAHQDGLDEANRRNAQEGRT